MIVYVDVDGTLCETVENADYSKAKPTQHVIDHVNELYENGHEIVIYTARGCTTGMDWRKVTENQLKAWGVKYHRLRLDKPYYDLMICDKTINPRRGLDGRDCC